jgi:hypothetical protein
MKCATTSRRSRWQQDDIPGVHHGAPGPEDMFPGVVQRLSDSHLRRNMSGCCQVHAVSTRISTVRVHFSLSRARTWHLIWPVNATEASPFQFISASSSAGGPKQTPTPSSLGPTRRTVSRVHLSLVDSKGGGDEGDADGELDVQQGIVFPTKRRPLERSRQPNFVP